MAGVLASAASVSFGDDDPIVLSGEPRRLRGTMVLRNDAAEQVVLRRNRIAPAGSGVVRDATRLPAIRLAPSARTVVPLRLRLDPHTPPGEYRETLEIGGVERDVLLVVAERLRVRVSPPVIAVPTVPGGRIGRRITVENRGNVPVTLPATLVAVLDDDRFTCRVLRRALAEVDADDATMQGYLDQLIRSGKATIEQTGHVGIRVEDGPVTITPGQLRPVGLDLQLPDGIDRRSRYRGVVPIATADLTIDLVPVGGDDEPPVPRDDSESATHAEEPGS